MTVTVFLSCLLYLEATRGVPVCCVSCVVSERKDIYAGYDVRSESRSLQELKDKVRPFGPRFTFTFRFSADPDFLLPCTKGRTASSENGKEVHITVQL